MCRGDERSELDSARRAELSFSNAEEADFRNADLVAATMYRAEAISARFDDALLSEKSDIPT